MVEHYVQANSLSCLLDETFLAEMIPEPFRMQGSVSFRVTYSEYSNYILSLPMDSGITLMSDFAYLRNLATTGSPKLYLHFLKDLSFAICKELWFAEYFSKDASIILPASFNGNDIPLSSCLQSYIYCRDVEGELLDRVQSAGFKPYRVKRQMNIALHRLAVILYSMSKVSDVMEEVNLVYDLA